MGETLIGRVLLDQFRVDSFLASGGMGEVYKAWDIRRNTVLAMKVLHADLADDPSVLKRFKREARALAKLTHPNIVPFYGLYQTDETAFLLEAFISGPTLKDVLRQQRSKPLPLAATMSILKAVTAALGYAHANGIVHCDVKPGNIMIDSGGVIFLTDFGIARHADSTTTTLSLAGTPAYMAPEQIRDETVSAATDVYALGLVLYEMLTGERPFKSNQKSTENHGTTQRERLYAAQLSSTPPDLRSLNPNIPQALAAVVLQALEKEPSKRYATTIDLFQEACLALGVSPNGVDDRINPSEMAGILPQMAAQTAPTGFTTFDQIPPPPVKRWTRYLPVGLAAGALLAAALLVSRPTVIKPGGGSPTQARAAYATADLPIAVDLPTATTASVVKTATTVRAAPTNAVALEPSVQPTEKKTKTPKPTNVPGSSITSPKDGMLQLYVPAGEFLMGAANSDSQAGNEERPQRTIYLDAYWVDQTEVTNDMFAKFVKEASYRTTAEQRGKSQTWAGQNWTPTIGANWMHPDGPGSTINGKGSYPVSQVSWFDAQAYCSWAGRRLPTEAEWEKAARGTDGNLYPWGNQAPDASLANFADQSFVGNWGDKTVNDGYAFAAPVGSYPAGASSYGALDMAGNLWEWVTNWYSESYQAKMPDSNPPGPKSGDEKMIRGGGWGSKPQYVRTTNKDGDSDYVGSTGNGFRCVEEE